MNTVWIVLRNGKVDEVFNNKESAIQHQKNLTKRWNLTELLEKEVKLI